ncbi:MAG: Mrp/NBP35 family ATP-binding protein [Candidatus Bostrichicola ureolyticus]|nr:MAG: Mrp/NBP35 family ATP-binding protein [Candidatus Bostrichicola ureolyticus]
MDNNHLKNILKEVIMPGENINIIDKGIISNIEILNNKNIIIYLSLENPALHIRNKIYSYITNIIHKKISNDIKINFNFKKFNKYNNIKNIIAIASGKGGVGKSTIATNISAYLSKQGFKTGILDADIYGPSIPIMFNIENDYPTIINKNGINNIIPIINYGVKIFSFNFFIQNNPAVWRGPMVSKILHQLIKNIYWENLDFLIIDLPPGTGDIHLSIMQEFLITGVIIVSTPQKISISDVKKTIAMFNIDNIKVPIIGLIENMAFFIDNEFPNKKYFLFGKNGIKKLSNNINIPFLGEIPILEIICESSDNGNPIILNNNINYNYKNYFIFIMNNIFEQINKLI